MRKNLRLQVSMWTKLEIYLTINIYAHITVTLLCICTLCASEETRNQNKCTISILCSHFLLKTETGLSHLLLEIWSYCWNVSNKFVSLGKGLKKKLIILNIDTLSPVCTSENFYFEDMTNRCMFYQCDDHGNIFHMPCPGGLMWDQSDLDCVRKPLTTPCEV